MDSCFLNQKVVMHFLYQTASSDEISSLVKADEDPLQYEPVPTVKQILSNSSILESINVDEEAMKFFFI
jgi:hypothetical protein